MARSSPHTTVGTAELSPSAGELMTVEEATHRFRGQWVLMKVTEKDDHYWPSRGYVLAHSFEERDLIKALKREPKPYELPPGAPRSSYYTFCAYPQVTSGPAYEAAMRKLALDLEAGKARYDARTRR